METEIQAESDFRAIGSDKEVMMLVLSRKAMQSVMIGSDVRITVIRVEGNQVRIGIEAPSDVRILRGELIVENEGPLTAADQPLEFTTAAS